MQRTAESTSHPLADAGRSTSRILIWIALFLIAHQVVGWFIFGYDRGEWSNIALAVGFIGLAMSHLQPRNYKVWRTLAWIGIGLSLVRPLLKLVGSLS